MGKLERFYEIVSHLDFSTSDILKLAYNVFDDEKSIFKIYDKSRKEEGFENLEYLIKSINENFRGKYSNQWVTVWDSYKFIYTAIEKLSKE